MNQVSYNLVTCQPSQQTNQPPQPTHSPTFGRPLPHTPSIISTSPSPPPCFYVFKILMMNQGMVLIFPSNIYTCSLQAKNTTHFTLFSPSHSAENHKEETRKSLSNLFKVLHVHEQIKVLEQGLLHSNIILITIHSSKC